MFKIDTADSAQCATILEGLSAKVCYPRLLYTQNEVLAKFGIPYPSLVSPSIHYPFSAKCKGVLS